MRGAGPWIGAVRKSTGHAAAIVAIAAGLVSAAAAQTADCDRLRDQIAAIRPTVSKDAARFAAAAQKQQGEIQRTIAYSRSIGCENRQFLIFGSPPPPQCGGLRVQIQRMQDNLAGLQVRARIDDGSSAKQALQARYDASCRGRPGGLFDSLFRDNSQPREDFSPADQSPGDVREVDADADRPRAGSLAVCVRACDGGYFPVSYSARASRLAALDELCKAQCPGTEAALYTMPASGSIEQAVSVDGDAYTDLANAGKFRKVYTPSCGCKPAHKSWAESLAQAEELLGQKSKSDVIVTEEKANALSRAGSSKLSPDKVRALLRGEAAAGAADANGAAAPDTPGPNADKLSPTATYGLNDGVTSEKPDASGARKPVRVVGPKL